MQRLSLILTPADVTVFRDTRPFEPGATGSRSEFPLPRALAGAVRTWLLRNLGANLAAFARRRRSQTTGHHTPIVEDLRECVPPEATWVLNAHLAGPWVCQAASGETYFAAPFHLARLTDAGEETPFHYAFPWKAPGGRTLPGLEPPAGYPQPASNWRPALVPTPHAWEAVTDGFLTADALARALAGKDHLPRTLLRTRDTFFNFEARLGIGVDPARGTAEEGRLYTTEFLRFAWEGGDGGRPYGLRVDLCIPESAWAEAERQVRAVAAQQPEDVGVSSQLLPALGYATLQNGSPAARFALALFYGYYPGHAHYDRLNLEVYGYDHPLIPDLGYPETADGFDPRRSGWLEHTAVHNTVMVNARKQKL
ncbi:MAG: type III-B CRISPR module-associated Cmr3 family protein, partial [Armatimonadota bacterium]|nr:type III-B CRISPR module-associated Cmr3 family protein [Armatimonadota bacterium]